MCRNIKTLFNFEPPATDEEVRDAAVQFVRKLSGFTKPSKSNEAAFETAVDEIARAAQTLLDSLVTNGTPRHRDVEAAKARARAAQRFGKAPQGHSAAMSASGAAMLASGEPMPRNNETV